MVTLPEVHEPIAEDDLEVIEVRSALTVLTWAALSVLAGLAVMGMLLLLGPLLGSVGLVTVVAAIVHRYGLADRER